MTTRLLALLVPVLILAGCRGERASERPAPLPAPAAIEEAAASHILVAWTGCRDCPPAVDRSREAALERARQIAVMLRTGRGEFTALARKYSDDATAARNGGYLGAFRRGEMDPLFEMTVFALEAGAVSEPIETDYGWHIVRREEVRRARTHHILVAWRDAVKAAAGVTRGRDEARQIADALRREAVAPNADLCKLALKFSDDPHSRLECGDLGWVEPGILQKNVDAILFRLAPHEVSPVIETEYGFHVFWRD